MSKYSEADVKQYIEESEVFVISCILALNKRDAIKPKDTGLVESMLRYFEKFDKITDKHFGLIRRRLVNYADTLAEWMNELIPEYEAAHGAIVK